MREHLARVAAVLGAVAGLSACAVTYEDADGARHVIGLTSTKIVSADRSTPLAGDVVQVESLGILVSRNAQGETLSIGYSSETTAAIRNDAFVAGYPAEAIRKIMQSRR